MRIGRVLIRLCEEVAWIVPVCCAHEPSCAVSISQLLPIIEVWQVEPDADENRRIKVGYLFLEPGKPLTTKPRI